MFRSMDLPKNVAGKLFLHSMPGRYEPLSRFHESMRGAGITCVVCLVPMVEIEWKSPEYAQMLKAGAHEWRWEHFPVRDFTVPDDKEQFLRLAQNIAARLRSGEHVLAHCGAGIGRTGTFSAAVLMALGLARETALQIVAKAGAGPDTATQADLLHWVAERLPPPKA